MGVFEEYINGLEGKTDLDPQAIAKDLLGLHNQEIGTVNEMLSSATAKIAEQDNVITTNAQTLAETQAEISRVKSQNYDLIMSTGINNNDANGQENDDRVIDSSTITPDDLFVKN